MSIQSLAVQALADLSESSIRSLKIEQALEVAERLAGARTKPLPLREDPLQIAQEEEALVQTFEDELERILNITGGRTELIEP